MEAQPEDRQANDVRTVQAPGARPVNLGDWRISTQDEWFLKHRGNIRKIELVVSHFRMGLQFVQGTERILTCHRRHAEMYSKPYDLRIVNAPFEIPPIEMLMGGRSGSFLVSRPHAISSKGTLTRPKDDSVNMSPGRQTDQTPHPY
ncbi:hypothetical protein ACRQ5Q_26365 [Bradyrhizobium sp. PMVTL-01]|uniref:hypothetical protein n=1 Tax=Bradyrhizobium sp. PMVTL-01 TaxID=3434999 RepID=UPI003F6FAB79